MDVEPFKNRLRKNLRYFRPWAARQRIDAYRLYDRDMPEFPVAVDWYAGRVHLLEYPRRKAIREGLEPTRAALIAAISEVTGASTDAVFVKTHEPKVWGESQYERAGRSERFVVEEQGLRFWVDLGGYLDSGLFLDHRKTRAMVRELASGKRFLNLFAYTGSFTVYAAHGGARSSVTVDLSSTYLDWARDNLKLNALAAPQHRLERADTLAWLGAAVKRGDTFDLAVVDPPSFSASKRMEGSFNVQRDHRRLLEQALSLIAPGGVLFFSTNFRSFALDERLESHPGIELEELTPKSLPEDFSRRDAHRCWRFSVRSDRAETTRAR